jgi:hypothetical protein
MEMWVVHCTTPPPLRLETPPPPPTHMEEVSSNDFLLSDSSDYNDECPHVKEVSLSIWTGSRFQLFSRISKMCAHSFQIKKLEKKLAVVEKELQQARKDNQALAWYIDTKRKNEEVRKKEAARKKAEEEVAKKEK